MNVFFFFHWKLFLPYWFLWNITSNVCHIEFLCILYFTDMTQLYLICLASVLSYNYLISKLLISCQGCFTLGEVQIIAQGIIIFGFHSINSLRQVSGKFFKSFMIRVFFLLCNWNKSNTFFKYWYADINLKIL